MSMADDITEGRVCQTCMTPLVRRTGYPVSCTECGGKEEAISMDKKTAKKQVNMLEMFRYAQELAIPSGFVVMACSPWHFQLRDVPTGTIINFWPTRSRLQVVASSLKDIAAELDDAVRTSGNPLAALVFTLITLKDRHAKDQTTQDPGAAAPAPEAEDDTPPF